MYGVPTDLPLQRFVGDSITQIAFGQQGIHFNFEKAGSICVDFGKWQIHDSSGTIVDESIGEDALASTRQQYRVHVILGSAVTKFEIDAPRSFTLTFASGHRLTVYDDSQQYESFAIEPDGIYI
jgi:hypothetical protein